MIRRSFLVALLALAPLAAHAQFSRDEYRARRDSLVARVPSGVIVALGSPEPVEDYLVFIQNENFNYLTGFLEPDAALVMTKRDGRVQSTLFVQPRDPGQETWTGARLGVERVRERTGMEGRAADDLMHFLDSLATRGDTFYVIGDFRTLGRSSDVAASADDQRIGALRSGHPGLVVKILNNTVLGLRGRKSTAEQAMVRKAVDITVLAQKEAMRALEPGMNEFEIQALVEYTFRRNGADRPSFSTIIGSGPNSTVLHYNTDDRFIRSGDLVVMDIGSSYKGYSADVTRTIPATGRFTQPQKDIYQIVRNAQKAAEAQAKVGVAAHTLSEAANASLTEGLKRVGLIDSSGTFECPNPQANRAAGDTTAVPKCPQLFLYYFHGLGHGIGLAVHDPDQYGGGIKPGSAFTIEPGVYVRANVLDLIPDTPRNRALIERLRPAVEKYKNMGVRIEDDYVATEKGVEWISRAPREIAEIEALMKQPWTGPAKRNPALVESYRPIVP